jgi:coiled-coil domain-containing protein 130
VEKGKKAVDDRIKDRYGLPETLTLLHEDDKAKSEAIKEWEKGRRELELREISKRRRLASEGTTVSTSSTTKFSWSRPASLPPGSTGNRGPNSAVSSLRARILENTARHSGPFTDSGK